MALDRKKIQNEPSSRVTWSTSRTAAPGPTETDTAPAHKQNHKAEERFIPHDFVSASCTNGQRVQWKGYRRMAAGTRRLFKQATSIMISCGRLMSVMRTTVANLSMGYEWPNICCFCAAILSTGDNSVTAPDEYAMSREGLEQYVFGYIKQD